APEDPWVLVEQAFLEGQRDRPEAALELARAALALRPSYRPALLRLAHQLTDLRRPEEAVALLDASASQSYTVHHYRAELWLQLGDPARAEAAAHEALEAAPLVELAVERGLRALRAEAFYRARRYRRARRELEGIERPRSEEHTSELQSRENLVCRLLLERAPAEIHPLSLHAALPICRAVAPARRPRARRGRGSRGPRGGSLGRARGGARAAGAAGRGLLSGASVPTGAARAGGHRTP